MKEKVKGRLGGSPTTLGREEYNRRYAEYSQGRRQHKDASLHKQVFIDTDHSGDDWYGIQTM